MKRALKDYKADEKKRKNKPKKDAILTFCKKFYLTECLGDGSLRVENKTNPFSVEYEEPLILTRSEVDAVPTAEPPHKVKETKKVRCSSPNTKRRRNGYVGFINEVYNVNGMSTRMSISNEVVS